ncbi:ferric reductase-like transmembrane domain-containing protein [Sulfitobacter sp. D35]|uniref:ferric reductase-like transmembrane domain-containing protein n=1 Tax=Sulfitobacter sp. D35 TaxID=3083252 RepID=UPI00296E77E1|nr:ferric reductase-like transmembrane domain-containing protein [Sulfitobacter sp. D35]MDW4499734.1 ferric reductase-like transmembrane domain-containing protein [Sulfitobacter sp. D35]
MQSPRPVIVWSALALIAGTAIIVAATSPLLAWRGPVYVLAGLAGVIAMVLVLIQPLLAGGYLPGLPARRGRQVHAVVGMGLLTAVVIHVAGLWITSPPDVVDALLFVSPTPFSAWGVVAMWALFAAAVCAALYRRRRIGPRVWRLAHTALVSVVVLGSIVHALLIEGTMGQASKIVLCLAVAAALAKVVFDLRTWRLVVRRGPSPGTSERTRSS